MASVSIRDAVKRYGKVEVLHGVSAEISDGEFIVLVGPSGCGKSTLLRMIAGLEDITDGEIDIGGRIVNDIPPKGRDISMVFQNYALYPHMTVEENMAFSMTLAGAPKEEKRRKVREAAEILGLTSLLQRKPKALSGGQRQRVAMGRSIVREPQVFLFDEPLSNLDAKLRVQMRSEIKALHRRLKSTMIYVTHDQIEAMTMADRIIVMQAGRIEQIGTPLELFDKPINLFVAQFIGSPAMNLFEGVIRGEDVILEGGVSAGLSNCAHYGEGRNVVVGKRPADVQISAHSGLPSTVENVEPTGSETFIELCADKNRIAAILHQRTEINVGDRCFLDLSVGDTHFFDAESGLRLS